MKLRRREYNEKMENSAGNFISKRRSSIGVANRRGQPLSLTRWSKCSAFELLQLQLGPTDRTPASFN